MALDSVGDVGDHLDGAAEEVAASLALDYLFVYLAAGDVAGAGERDINEALVVAEVEIGLGAVDGDKDLAVLGGAHGARIDVDVRVELHDRHFEASGLENPAD